MMRQIVRAAMVLLAAFTTAQGAQVHVNFHNGDRLTGDLIQVDSQTIQFQPAASALSASVKLHWDADEVDSIHFVDNPASTACVYLSGAPPSSRAGQFSATPLCLKTGAVISKADPSSLKLVISAPSPASTSTRARPLEAETYSGFASLSTKPSPAPIAPEVAPLAAAGSQNVKTIWSFNVNAPEAIQQATQSSQNFGGLAAVDLYANDTEHLSIAAGGTSMHNLNLHKPAITTDLFDSTARFSRAIPDNEKRQYSFFVDGEWFFNTALGIATERSAGAGFGTRTFYSPSENLSFKAWADVRYFNERLYNAKKLDLVGSVINGELNYFPSNNLWFFTVGFAFKPMYNNWSAWQGNGSLTLTIPLNSHFCLGLTPADDTYINNSPAGFRHNFLKSSASLQILVGSNPDQKCQ